MTMTKTLAIVKRVEWSYPTSDNAERLGFGKTGCYSVEVGEENKPFRAIIGFASLVEARFAAEAMPMPWSRLTR